MKGIAVLKRNTDFRRLYRQGKSAVTSTLVVYAMPNRQGIDRLGLTGRQKGRMRSKKKPCQTSAQSAFCGLFREPDKRFR